MEKKWLAGFMMALLLLSVGYLAADGREIRETKTEKAAGSSVRLTESEKKKELPERKSAKQLRPEPLAVKETVEETEPAVTVGGKTDTAYLLLVNREHPLAKTYQPELVPVTGHNAAGEKRAVEALEEMLAAGTREGLRFVVCSGYRTEDEQRKLYLRQIQKKLAEGFDGKTAVAEAEKYSALPGCSEHQSGLAFDIVALSYQTLNEGYEETEEAIWLRKHAEGYGFILRYPKEKEAVTGIGYEPWHFRYVGTVAARAITRGGLTLEEYVGISGD